MVSSHYFPNNLRAGKAKNPFSFGVQLIVLLIFIPFYIFSQGKEVLSLPESALSHKTFFLKNDYRLLKFIDNDQCVFQLIGPGVDTIISKVDNVNDTPSLGHLIGDEDEFFIMMFPELNVKIFSKRTGGVLIAVTAGGFVSKANILVKTS